MRIAMFVISILLAAPVLAQDKSFTLSSPPALEASGLWKFLVPRFKLKTGVRVNFVDGPANVEISTTGDMPVFSSATAGERYFMRADESVPAQVFVKWLESDIGKRTIRAFTVDGVQMFLPSDEDVKAAAPAKLPGSIESGARLALRKCGRCHVVGDINKYNGISSTPSFAALRAIPDWRRRFTAFWTINPHPSFTQIAGITPPFAPESPPALFPIFLTMKEADDIAAFAESVTPLDLGGH